MSCGYDLLRELLYMDCKCSGRPSVGGEKVTPTTAGEVPEDLAVAHGTSNCVPTAGIQSRASPALPIQPTIEGQIEAETPEVSQLSTQQHIESCNPQGSPTKMAPLMKAEVLVLFQLANRNAEVYRPGSKTGFWSHLQEDFAKETGKQHKSLHRVLRRETERRRAYLDSLRTGQTDSESELTVQIDNWIDVVVGAGYPRLTLCSHCSKEEIPEESSKKS
ncbi:hypothetical protein GMDG_08732 [Pseudogymnoascus destructans 20631-21]|uniref:Myb/SANT-like domain-containing protein n=1 Tax=Pseudogymnoascus destructans (strain ATCC MYA-4855 / 20631-21) TaxID=658429 RepID=L8GC55_PSED2|nr:hypothetical protein GMDG_08732 [Pseudogymnoascus destructans 20631-21]